MLKKNHLTFLAVLLTQLSVTWSYLQLERMNLVKTQKFLKIQNQKLLLRCLWKQTYLLPKN
ncbi:hypothetical protein CsSME_00034813 [Camellia sinensis var. sinensis]